MREFVRACVRECGMCARACVPLALVCFCMGAEKEEREREEALRLRV